MNYEEMKKKYPQEWVLVEFAELNQDLSVKEGTVIAHSPDRDEVYRQLSRTKGKNIAVEYLGSASSDLTVMFFFK